MKLIIASNRLPVFAEKKEDGFEFRQSPGDLFRGFLLQLELFFKLLIAKSSTGLDGQVKRLMKKTEML